MITRCLIGLVLTAVVTMTGGCGGGARARAMTRETPVSAVTGRWAIVVHGGAGMLDRTMPEERKAAYRAGLADALNAGRRVLEAGGSSMDAVEAAVRVLEDHELFNAGRGSVLTRAGGVEMDASVMDGLTLKCGAVAGVRTVKNPVSLARRVMERTPHILFAADGAEALAGQWGVERMAPEYFITPRRREQLDRKLRELGVSAADSAGLETEVASAPVQEEDLRGTVGCVALDMSGNIAAATSTGGMTGKMPGRIGDSPIIGAGNYANNATLGVSCTGTGEQFIRHVAAHELSSLVRYARMSLDQAADVVLTQRLNPDDGGLIAIGRDGTIVMKSTTGCMPCAAVDSRGRMEVRIWDPEP